MSEFSYIAQRYSQGSSNSKLITFCASASDILDWGGVPAKNERFHGGFQRALSQRYRRIINFFNKGQASPGAVVVAFRPGTTELQELGYPSGWPDGSDLTVLPEFVRLKFEADSGLEGASTDELAERVCAHLRTRPGFSPTEDSDENEEPYSDGSVDDDQSEPDQDGEDAEDDLDVGQSKLAAFYSFISDRSAIDTWIKREEEKIAAIKAKGRPNQREREYIKFGPEERLRATLVSLLRPAMIVDGQHRINGADSSDATEIQFTVCAILDADWVEQVFQFVILNRMARPISKDFLTELLNTSLTNDEISEIDKRLEIVGIKNADRKIHKAINHDDRSPFKDLIAAAGEVAGLQEKGKLSQQGMLRLAKRWRAVGGQGKTAEMSCFIPFLNAASLTEARRKWAQFDSWIRPFFLFWATVRDIYSDQQIWEKKPKYHLLYIVTLQAMQDHFLEAKALGRVRFKSEEDFVAQVRDFFEPVPATFFMNWSETGLQSGKGWQMIKDALTLFQNGTKLAGVQEQSGLFGE